jgi:hypothetical protein
VNSARAGDAIRPAQFFEERTAFWFCIEIFHQLHYVHLLFHLRTPAMPKSKKKATELTTEEALKRLFPAPVRNELKKIAASATRKSQKRKQND